MTWRLWFGGFVGAVLVAMALAAIFGAAGVAPGVLLAALWGRVGYQMRHSGSTVP